MAYQIQGDVIINNTRDLIGINTAGIDAALFVGEQIQLDAGSGIVTAVEYRGDGSKLTGIITSGGGGGTIVDLNVTGIATLGNLIVTGVATFNNNIDLNSNDILNGGDASFESLDVAGHIEGDTLQISGLSTFAGAAEFTQISFTGGDADENLTGITTDLNESAGATEAVTAEGVKAYVDGSVGAANQLNFVGDDGVNVGDIDLASENLDFQGTVNQIDTEVTVGAGNTVLFTLSSTLELPGSMAFAGGDADENFTGITTDLTESAGATEAVTAAGVVDYVSGQVGGNSNLTIVDDAAGIGTIALGTESFVINGTANEVTAVVSGDPGVLTLGLAEDVLIAGDLTVTNDFGFDGGQIVNVIGIETSLVDTVSGVATNTSIPTQLAVKTYVDAAITETGGALNFEGGTGSGSVDLSSQTFSIVGTNLEVETVGAGQSITIGLPDNVSITSLLTTGAGAVITGVCTATDFNSTSDIRKKDNIVEIDEAVAKVQALRGVTFDWKDGSGSSAGVIAQEVEAVLPTLVKEGADHKTVVYNGLIGLLVQAVKEQADQIAALQEKLG
jgi:hypothetical protein